MRKILPLLLASFLGWALLSHAFAQQNPQTQEALSAQNPFQTEASAPPKLVTAIEVMGNKAISSNTVISKMKTRIGSPYQENVISDDLKRLYLLGFFSDIKIDTEDYKDGLKIIIQVSERPIIEKITFTGIVHITMKDDKLKEQLKSREKQYLDYPKLTEDVRILQKMYEKMGFTNANITYKADVNKETNRADVQFIIVEDKKVRIKNISVEGAKAFSTGKILRLMKTKQAWFFNAGLLKDDVIKEDMERLKAFYQRNGYTDIKVDYTVKADEKKPYLLYVTVRISEGKKYLVGNVTVQGNKDLPEKDILARLKECTPGKVFSPEFLRRDVSNIQSLYFDRGYIMAQVQETTSLNSYTGRVDIVYNITESEVAYVDKIKVRGNVKTKDLIIRREMRIYPGDKFDGDKLRRSKERLQNLGFFDEVSYDTEDTEAENKKNLVVDVKEAKTGSFSFGGGYSTVDSFVGFVQVEQKNFDWKNWPYFTGAGQNLTFRGTFGTVDSGFDLSFTEPWLFDYPISFGFDGYKREHKRDQDVGYGYDEKVTGGDVRIGKELTEYLRANLMYRYDHMEISNPTDDASNYLKEEVGTSDTSSITPSLTFDSRDNMNDPKKGNFLEGSYQWAGLGGNRKFWKGYGRASHYFPMPMNSVFEVRGRLGAAKAFSSTPRVPIYERWFAGGAYTIRGYEERKIGPIDPQSGDPLGGEAMIVGNLEYTYPLFDFLKVAAFFDTGNVWEKIKDLGKGGYKSGFGLGVRMKTPIGPIMLDYGIPLNRAPGQEERTKGGRFHFSASHGF